MKKFAGNNPEVEFGYVADEDPSCWVTCDCGKEIEKGIYNREITRCPNCGKGYISEFVVWQYDVDELVQNEDK